MNWIAFILGICAVIATERIVSVIREFFFERYMANVIIDNSKIAVGDDDEEAEDEHQGRDDPA